MQTGMIFDSFGDNARDAMQSILLRERKNEFGKKRAKGKKLEKFLVAQLVKMVDDNHKASKSTVY